MTRTCDRFGVREMMNWWDELSPEKRAEFEQVRP